MAGLPRASHLSEESLRQMKLQYLHSVVNLERSDSLEETNIDISEWAKIFQAMNFKLRHFDSDQQPKSDEPSYKSGIKVVITCMKTNERLILVNENNTCSCPIKNQDEAVWEVVATSNSTQSLVESGSTLYPPMLQEQSALVKSFMNYVGGIASGKIMIPSSLISGTPSRRRSAGNPFQRLSIEANAPGLLHELPSRYRSLDTLISQEDDALPEPGPLLKPNATNAYKSNFTKSESNNSVSPSLSKLNLSTPKLSLTNSEVCDSVKTALWTAHEQLEMAMSLMNVPASLKKAEAPTAKIVMVKPGYMKLSKSSSSVDTISKTGVLRPELKVPTIKVKSASNAAKSSAVSSSSTAKPAGVIKKKDKYSHVLSTIPKYKRT